ncbi:hypothetical protein EG329_004250 [Mollisiaceae sp. DMI_Dod_QoI]|nr:hypothetical protein EG329_004250 [Helotiales sp. DMI_Dod_QoI]
MNEVLHRRRSISGAIRASSKYIFLALLVLCVVYPTTTVLGILGTPSVAACLLPSSSNHRQHGDTRDIDAHIPEHILQSQAKMMVELVPRSVQDTESSMKPETPLRRSVQAIESSMKLEKPLPRTNLPKRSVEVTEDTLVKELPEDSAILERSTECHKPWCHMDGHCLRRTPKNEVSSNELSSSSWTSAQIIRHYWNRYKQLWARTSENCWKGSLTPRPELQPKTDQYDCMPTHLASSVKATQSLDRGRGIRTCRRCPPVATIRNKIPATELDARKDIQEKRYDNRLLDISCPRYGNCPPIAVRSETVPMGDIEAKCSSSHADDHTTIHQRGEIVSELSSSKYRTCPIPRGHCSSPATTKRNTGFNRIETQEKNSTTLRPVVDDVGSHESGAQRGNETKVDAAPSNRNGTTVYTGSNVDSAYPKTRDTSENTDGTILLFVVIGIVGICLLFLGVLYLWHLFRCRKMKKSIDKTSNSSICHLEVAQPSTVAHADLFARNRTYDGHGMGRIDEEAYEDTGHPPMNLDGTNDGWTKWFLQKRGDMLLQTQKPKQFSSTPKNRPPRIPTLRLPQPTFSTVRKANGIPSDASMGHDKFDFRGKEKSGSWLKWTSTV